MIPNILDPLTSRHFFGFIHNDLRCKIRIYFTTTFYLWQVSLQDNLRIFTFCRRFSATYRKTFDKARTNNYNNVERRRCPWVLK